MAVKPRERIILHFDVEDVPLVIESPLECVRLPGFSVDVGELLDGSLHACEREEPIPATLLHEQRQGCTECDDVRKVELGVDSRNEVYKGMRIHVTPHHGASGGHESYHHPSADTAV